MEKFELVPKYVENKYHCKIKKILIVCSACSAAWGVSLEHRSMILTSDDLTCRNCGNVELIESRKIE
jgi:hypothetical protein